MQGYTGTIRKYATDDRFTGALRFSLKLDDGQFAAVRYQVFGCGFTFAVCRRSATTVPDWR